LAGLALVQFGGNQKSTLESYRIVSLDAGPPGRPAGKDTSFRVSLQ